MSSSEHITLAQLRQLNRELVEDKTCTLSEYRSSMMREHDKVKDPQLLTEIEIALGCKYSFSGEPVLALQHFMKGQKMYDALPKEEQDLWWLGTMHYSVANVHIDTLDFEKALHYYLSCIEPFREIGYEEEAKTGMLFVGYTMLKMGAGDDAIKYIKQAAEGSEKYPMVATRGYAFMGLAYDTIDDFEHAKQYYDKAFSVTDSLHRKFWIIRKTVPCCIALGGLEEAEKLLSMASNIAAQIEFDNYRKITLFIMQAQVATAHQSYERALSKCDDALTLAVETNNLLDLVRIKLQQARILFVDEQFDMCQVLLENLTESRLPSDVLVDANKLLLNLYEVTEQWEKAYRLLHEIRKTSLFAQSRLRAIEQLLDSRQSEKMLKELVAEKTAEVVKALEQSERANDVRSNILKTVMHEFRTPLTIISSSSSLLRKHAVKMSREKQTKLHTQITESTQHLSSLLSEVVKVENSSTGNLEPIFSSVSVGKWSEHLCESLDRQVKYAPNVTFVFDAADETTIEIDSDMTKAIVSELLTNAVKYTPDSKPITVEMGVDDGHLVVTVADEGMGIAADEIDNIFELFYRAYGAGNIPGLGTGLYMAKVRTDALGGKIGVTSGDIGLRTVFSLMLPTQPKLDRT